MGSIDQIVIIHMSDLHISDTADFDVMQALPVSRRSIREFTGLAPGDPLHYVISGDFTKTGSPREFQLADDYLRSKCRIVVGDELADPVGLEIADQSLLARVPGNHDNWGGQSIVTAPGSDPISIRHHFGPLPWRRIWRSTAGRIELEIFGMDSSAGLSSAPAITQRGAFAQADLDSLQDLLAASGWASLGIQRIRAIVFHHALAFEARLTLAANDVLEGLEFARASVKAAAQSVTYSGPRISDQAIS